MKFFTDKTVVNDYLLVKIIDYWKLKDKSPWKEIFIDPGVYELTRSDEYSWVKPKTQYDDVRSFLDSLPENHYFSWDYPCDMNEKYTKYFLWKSWRNAKEFHDHPQYIITVQSRFHDYWSFRRWYQKYNDLEIASGILGLGNICRIFHKDDYIKHVLPHAFKYCKHPRIHIYGLGLRTIPFAYKLAQKYGIELSIDSTKWTRPFWCSGKYIRGFTRQELFDAYLAEINRRI